MLNQLVPHIIHIKSNLLVEFSPHGSDSTNIPILPFLNEILNFRGDALCSSAIEQNQIWVSAMFLVPETLRKQVLKLIDFVWFHRLYIQGTHRLCIYCLPGRRTTHHAIPWFLLVFLWRKLRRVLETKASSSASRGLVCPHADLGKFQPPRAYCTSPRAVNAWWPESKVSIAVPKFM